MYTKFHEIDVFGNIFVCVTQIYGSLMRNLEKFYRNALRKSTFEHKLYQIMKKYRGTPVYGLATAS